MPDPASPLAPDSSDPWSAQLPDHGPVYTETLHRWNPYIVEPCNAITASIFVFIVIYWLVRLRGRYRSYPFMMCGMAILLAGGIGGTIYHAFREWRFFFYLDVVPIVLLSAVAAIYLWIRLRPKWMYVFLAVSGVLILNLAAYFFRPQRHLAIILHYLSLAALVITPLVVVLVRTRYRHANWIKLAVVCFGFAFLFRFLDPVLSQLPPGTHFLWHLGGAATTYCLMEYFYRIESEPLVALPLQPVAV